MAAVAEIRYAAVKPLPLQTGEGERLLLQPGELVPAELHGPWLNASLEGGKVVEVPVFESSLEQATDEELTAEADRRGIKFARKR